MEHPLPVTESHKTVCPSYWYGFWVLLAVGVGLLAMFAAGDAYGGDGVLAVLVGVGLLWLLFIVWFRTKYGRFAISIIWLGLFAQCGGCLVTFQPLLTTYLIHEGNYRAHCGNKLRQIGLAINAYHRQLHHFPPAYVADASGKPTRSWRVLLLPYMEGQSIYDAFDFKEPWDGPHNQKLKSLPMTWFLCPHRRWRDGTSTSYLAVTGPGTAWPGATGSKLEDLRHAPENTILVVEVAQSGVAWSEPRDLDIRDLISGTNGPAPSSNHGQGGVNVLFADGSVRYVDWNRLRAHLGSDGAVQGNPKDFEIAFPPDNR